MIIYSMKLYNYLKVLMLVACGQSLLIGQSEYAGTYYGELDEEIKFAGHTIQSRKKINSIAVHVTTDGSLTVTGINGVSGQVDADGSINFFENGFGFTAGSISGLSLSANGQHEQDGGLRVNQYWLDATQNTPVSSVFPDATQEANNQNFIAWFGYFNGLHFPWIAHQSLGNIYVQGNDETTLWMYFQPLGWMATNRDQYPWMYDVLLVTWVYYDTSIPISQGQWFFNNRTEKWFSVNNP